LNAILQGSVDREIQEVGFVPEATRHGSTVPRITNGHSSQPNGDQWECSDKQEIEALAKDRFNLFVKSINKLQASGFIEELIERYGPKKTSGNGSRSFQRRGARR